MSWRPKDWKNPHPYTRIEGDTEVWNYRMKQRYDAHEAGADTIIESFKDRGLIIANQPKVGDQVREMGINPQCVSSVVYLNSQPGYLLLIVPKEIS